MEEDGVTDHDGRRMGWFRFVDGSNSRKKEK